MESVPLAPNGVKRTPVYPHLSLEEHAFAALIAQRNRDEEENDEQARRRNAASERSLRASLNSLFGPLLDAYRPLCISTCLIRSGRNLPLYAICCDVDGIRFAMTTNSACLLLLIPHGDDWQVANDETSLDSLADVADVLDACERFYGREREAA